jgi:hypothetical protein
VHLTQDGSVGALSKNGTWTGVIRMLVDQVVDVAVGDVTMTSQRVMVVDFSVPLLLSRYAHCANWIIVYFTFFTGNVRTYVTVKYLPNLFNVTTW